MLVTILSILFILVCVLLIFMVVITPSQSEGLAGAFGGMGSDTFFGTKAGQHINRFTIFLAVMFMVLAIGINRLSAGEKKAEESILPSTTEPAPAPPSNSN
ncbi:MAG: preprotein translocase subunit SecG [Planctomycetes bacterium]|nr:preprotein translocase subunit SecG [Planctomycetota bacterium]